MKPIKKRFKKAAPDVVRSIEGMVKAAKAKKAEKKTRKQAMAMEAAGNE